MPRDSYMPAAQIEQVAWSQNLKDVVTPLAAAYGVPAAVMTSFGAINDSLQVAWTTASSLNTRTRGSVADKNDALKTMKTAARQIVGIIQSNPAVTDQMKIDAKVTVRKTHPTPVPVPTTSPVLVVKSVSGRTVTLELRQSAIKRGRPAKVSGASVFVGTANASTSDTLSWNFYANTSKTTLDVVFPPSPTGDTVQITAFWSNSRSESGPAAVPISVNLPASSTPPVTAGLKMAA